MTKTLITGGYGLVGQYLQEVMPDFNYLSSAEYDLTSEPDVEEMFYLYQPKIVIHLAAKVGGIQDNTSNPTKYLEDNILMNTLILKHAHAYGVDRFIGMLSSCIYPEQVKQYPMTEDMLYQGPAPQSNFAYAMAKRAMAAQIDAYRQQYNKKYSYLIPSNLYGIYDKYEPHNSHFVASLLRKIYEAEDEIELWGDGTPLRQFMYAGDLAKVIKYVILKDVNENMNVGSSENYSIKKIANIAIRACGKPHLKIKFNGMLGGQHRKDISNSKLHTFCNTPFPIFLTSLESGIKHTYDQMKEKWDNDKTNK